MVRFEIITTDNSPFNKYILTPNGAQWLINPIVGSKLLPRRMFRVQMTTKTPVRGTRITFIANGSRITIVVKSVVRFG